MFAHFANNPDAIAWPRVLETLVSAGAPLDPVMAGTFARTFGVKIHSFYGTSESGGISFDDSPEVDEVATVGRPLPGVTITLRPEATEGAPIDGGRVHVAGDAVSSGYAGQAPTDEGFTDGGFLTGDFGRFDARQRLILTGRASSFINVAGKKIQPEEVEQVLRSMQGIEDVRVLGIADAVRGQQVVACVVAPADGLTAPRDTTVLRFAPRRSQDSADDRLAGTDSADRTRQDRSREARGARARAARVGRPRAVCYSSRCFSVCLRQHLHRHAVRALAWEIDRMNVWRPLEIAASLRRPARPGRCSRPSTGNSSRHPSNPSGRRRRS